ncbi:MAG: hypothetical protein LBK95_21655 [Bifidobacteriaceae bacterium]|jgi:hypothetical protein|nr:hypothetical protein [Bifidobacteriaceae bacterium]
MPSDVRAITLSTLIGVSAPASAKWSRVRSFASVCASRRRWSPLRLSHSADPDRIQSGFFADSSRW